MLSRRSTIAAFREAQVKVRWLCDECGASGPADLQAIEAAKGPGFVLCDRHPPCRTPGCTYWITFYANTGQVTMPLYTEEGLFRMMDRRTEWLARPRGSGE